MSKKLRVSLMAPNRKGGPWINNDTRKNCLTTTANSSWRTHRDDVISKVSCSEIFTSTIKTFTSHKQLTTMIPEENNCSVFVGRLKGILVNTILTGIKKLDF